MAKFPKHDVDALVRLTPLARVTDRKIWSLLVTPMVKAHLGRILNWKGQILETTEGLFPGDEVANLNDHRLYGGKTGYVRFPYHHSCYKTEYGAFIVKRDGVKFEAFGWVGDLDKKQGELIFKAALRDRRYDGTITANDTALVDFPYDDPKLNSPIHPGKMTVELSVYGFLPGSRVVAACGDKEFESFIQNPFQFLDRPELFRQYFDRAWLTSRGPGQIGAAIPDVSRLVPPQFEKIARALGYEYIEVAPSHYHVAMWAASVGYQFSHETDAKTMQDFAAGLKRIKASGVKLTRPQESWVAVVQSLRPDLIPDGLNLNGPVWPQDNIGPQNLWMHKRLTVEPAKR
jgi:hypothetical protein